MLRLASSRFKAATAGYSAAGGHSFFSTSTHQERLAGKVAVITGGASGIGKVTAAEFIRQGAKVIITDIQHQLGEETASFLGPNATFFPCDVTQESHLVAAIDLAVATHGRLDIIHNNAGIAGTLAPSITALDISSYDHTMSVNVRSCVIGIKHAARVMIPRRSGSILCTASDTAIIGGLAQLDYSVSKAAIVGLVRSAAAELSKHGIRVNCISPHAIATPLGVNTMMELFPGIDAGRAKEMMDATGVLKGTKCEAEDVAMAAVYLASDEAKYVNGHNLVVDGGFTVFRSLDFPPP